MIDWGSVPDWFAGGGTVAALFFAAVTARAALRSNSTQARQVKQLIDGEASREAAKVREQASKITAWSQYDDTIGGIVVCFNSSGQPVYNMTLSMQTSMGPISTLYAVKSPDVMPKTMNHATRLLREHIEASAEFRGGRIDWIALYQANGVRVALTFLDVDGRWWQRDAFGKLSEIDPPE